MRFLKGLVVFLLIVIIVGGAAFLGYNIFNGNLFGGGMNMSMNNGTNNTANTASDNTAGTNTNTSTGNSQNTNQTTSNSNMDMSNTNNTSNNMSQSAALPNPVTEQNRVKLGEAIDLINKALEQITIDPYSATTVPGTAVNNSMGQASQGAGTINIYPSDNSSVNIIPDNGTAGMTVNQSSMSNMNMGMNETAVNYNHVYDQAKLQQLHSGIYTIAQGILAINQLNDNLLAQSMVLEQQPFSYQTYVTRYNTALQNQANLKKAMTLLNNASVLINVNPYASDTGYYYSSGNMKQLHEGIYKFAQGMAILQSLNEDFINQMSASSVNAQNLVNNMGGMNMSSGTGLFGNLSLSTIFNIIIIVLVLGLILGVLGAIANLFKQKPKSRA